MTHIGDVLLKDGKPTGQMRALCGAVVKTVLPKGSRSKTICPVCERLNNG